MIFELEPKAWEWSSYTKIWGKKQFRERNSLGQHPKDVQKEQEHQLKQTCSENKVKIQEFKILEIPVSKPQNIPRKLIQNKSTVKEIFENYVTSESSIYILTRTTCIPINVIHTWLYNFNLSLIITCLIVGLIDRWTDSNPSFLCCYSKVAENCCLTGENMYLLSFPLSFLLERTICWRHSSPGHLQKWSRPWVEQGVGGSPER